MLPLDRARWIPNFKLLGSDVFLWVSDERLAIRGRGRNFTAVSEGSYNGPLPALPGPGARWTRTASAGVDFGQYQPLNSSTGVSVLVAGSPANSTTNRKWAFSQRTSGTNTPQFALAFNTSATTAAVQGRVTLYSRNTSGTASAVTSSSAGDVTGTFECYIVGNSNSTSSGYAVRSGVSLGLGTNAALTGTYPEATQRLRVGNAADYATDGALVHDDPLFAVACWPRQLDPDFALWLSTRVKKSPEILSIRRIWIPTSSAGVSGTAAITNANDTMSASGTTTVTGTSATTNANDTMSASGTVGNEVTGTAAVTNANDTMSASGTTTVTGTAAVTNANDTMSASGTTTVTGTAAVTNVNDTMSASGTTTVTGTAAVTNVNDSANASGWAGIISGTAAVTNNDDTMSAFGTSGTLTATGGYSMPGIYGPVVRKTMLDAVTATTTSDAFLDIGNGNLPTFHGSMTGTGAVSATVNIQARNVSGGVWTTLGTLSLSGTNSASAVYVPTGRYVEYRADCTAISGTAATLSVAMAG